MVDWNDGYILEGLDRTHILMSNLNDYLLDHQAIVKAGMNDKVKGAIDLLYEVYQCVGRLDSEDEVKENR